MSPKLEYHILELRYTKWLKGHTNRGIPTWTPYSTKAAYFTKKYAMSVEKRHPFTIRAVRAL